MAVTVEHPHQVELEDGTLGAYQQAGMEEQARRLEEELGRRAPALRTVRVPLRVNPTNVNEVIEALQQGLGALQLGQAEVHVHLTSGTPAMMAALMFLADAGPLAPAAIWQVLDPTALRDLRSGALLPARRVQRVHLGYLSERARVERSLALLRGMAFRAAAQALDLVSERSLVEGRRDRARAVGLVARAWERWDAGDFPRAQQLLIRANRALRLRRMTKVREAVDPQREALAELLRELDARAPARSSGAGLALVRSLYAAVLRRVHAGDGFGAAGLARMLFDEVLDQCLRRAGLTPGHVDAAELARLGRVSPRARAAVELAGAGGHGRSGAGGRAVINLRALGRTARRELVEELGRVGALEGLTADRLAVLKRAQNVLFPPSARPPAGPRLAAVGEACTGLIALTSDPDHREVDHESVPFGPRSVLAVVEAIEREL
jgi:hypothetical protein